ncbi:MAG: mono/diheme cytochrome c family protein [Limisphaerales bacterium]|jgi:mono/diheme cytochrome c family protein
MILSERSHCLLLALLIGTAVTVAAIDLPTLDEVRAAGARQSSFRNRPATAVGPEAPPPALGRFRKEIEPVLKAHCVRCHGPEKAKANLRIDTLNPDLLKGRDVDWWLEILAVLGNGEMPPPDKSEMPGPERTKAIEWLAGEIRMASRVRRATEGHSSFRRMTRYEYNYALQDLLGLSLDFARDLPPEAHSEDGFQNSSETLHMSVMQLETYRRIARKALLRATVHGPRPPVLYWGVTMKKAAQIEWSQQQAKLAKLRDRFKDDPAKQKQELDRLIASFEKPPARAHFKDRSTGRTVRHAWDYRGAKHAFKPTSSRPKVPGAVDHVAVLPQGAKQKLVVELGEKLPDEGTLRVRVRASRTAAEEDRIPSLQLEFGWQASNEGRALLRVSNEDIPVAAGPDNPEFYQWEVPLGDIYPRNSVRQTSPLGSTPNPSEHIRLVNSSASRGDIQIDYVEVAAPVHDQWPPASHQRIFFDSKNRHDEPVYVREVLTAFMSRAWRRKVTAEEVGQKIRLFQAMRPSCDTFEEAVVETLATVLASPDFLYLVRDETVRSSGPPSGPARLSEHELATRLAMFLWCSLPDDRLLKLAGRGQLSRADVLAGEVTRMLEDSRSQRFAKHFVRQWLDMQLLDFLKPGKSLELLLKEAMLQEPIVFFREILRRDESVLNFIHADYTMANERLARHYGLPEVYGNHFRRVKLDAGHRRGGLLTQAGLLAMNSSGADSHPLKRGIWMLESLLNDPPPPPPPAVPEIDLADPEVAKMSLKERIEDHRNHAACMSCHAKIDPWGIAFENYDAQGRWRDHIRGKPVDATSRLFNNEPLNGMDGLKRFLLENRQDQFVRAMAHKMTVYALGRPLTFADRSGVDEITAKVRRQGDGLATLIMQVATAELFLSK